MTTTDQIKDDLAAVIEAASRATGIPAKDIVRGTGRANGEVAARHAVYYLMARRGHGTTAIANAFGQTRSGVDACIRRVRIGTKAWDAVEKTRRKLGLEHAGKNC